MAGIVCVQCGASTPLPDDLRVPTFTCQYCNATLSTEHYAGTGAVRVDEMRAFFQTVVEQPSALATTIAPKLEHGDAGTRDAQCAHCGAGIAVPLTITIPTVHCASCGRTEPVSRYVSDAERFQLDMARQVAGNQLLRELLHTGLSCPRCGGHNALSEPVPVQIACSSCRHTILLSDFVPADAVDRARLKQTALEFKQGLMAKQEASARKGRYIVFAVVAAFVLVILTAAILTQT